jgi:hypothetical protein
VSDVAVAAVMLPTAPLLNVTLFRVAIGSNPNPLITRVEALAAIFAVLVVTTGSTVATRIAVPLFTVFVVTIAVRLPTMVGRVENVTVSEVDVAAVTVPTAPLLNTTVLLAAVESKPEPLMVMVFALTNILPVFWVTIGFMVATCTAAALLTPFEVTITVSRPADEAGVVSVTVSEVAVADVTVPSAPLLNVTLLLLAVVSKPAPLITKVVALSSKLLELLVTTGTTVPTCTAEPLLCELVVTDALRLPKLEGLEENVTVNDVAEAVVTVPAAPLSNVTALLPAVVENPKPVIIIVVAFAATLIVRLVTTGLTVAT